VEWQVDVVDGRYSKRLKTGTKDPLPENNWVWSPQAAINMHMPERWGYVLFSGAPAGASKDTLVDDPNERVMWALRRLYYRQARLRTATGKYASSIDALNPADIRVEGLDFRPSLQTAGSLYEMSASGFAGASAHITQDGRAWLEAPGSKPR
jgi:hypothetical protein